MGAETESEPVTVMVRDEKKGAPWAERGAAVAVADTLLAPTGDRHIRAQTGIDETLRAILRPTA